VNGAIATGIEASIDELEADESLVAGVLAANGPVFCAGADLKLSGEVEREALALAARIGENGPLAVRASYRIVRDGRDLDTAAHWDLSVALGWPVFSSEDAREGATAFVEKRKPVWKGK